MFSQQHHNQQQGGQSSQSILYRSSQPNAHPAGHVTSPTRRAFYPAHPYATSQGSGTQQSIQHVRPSSSADEQHRQALHAALYGPRTTASNGSNLLGNPAMGLFKAYDGPVPSKAALSEGTPMQVKAPLDPALLAAAAPWQADMVSAMADVAGVARGTPEEARGQTIRLNSAPPAPPGMSQAGQRPPVGYTTYCKERGMGPRLHSSAPLLQAQQHLQMQMARQHAQSQTINETQPQRSSLDLGGQTHQAQQAETPSIFGRRPRSPAEPGGAHAEVPKRPSQGLQEVIMQAAANAAKHRAHLASRASMHHTAHSQEASSSGAAAPSGKAPEAAVAPPHPYQTALYQRPPVRTDTKAGQEHKAKHQQLLAHLAATAAAKPPPPQSPSSVSAEVMQLSPVYNVMRTPAAPAPAKKARAHGDTEMSESGSDSAAITHWGSQGSSYLECEDEGQSPAAYPGGKQVRVLQLSSVYDPTVYPDHASGNALASANKIMSRLTIPGDVSYLPVRFESKLFALGVRFGFTAFSIALGSSYFQRLLAVMPQLEFAVRRCGPTYADYLTCLPPRSKKHLQELQATYGPHYTSPNHLSEEATLCSIQFTCVYLATKIVDRMPMMEMLRYILTHLYGSLVSKSQAYDVESKCLEGLKFRLGPYFSADVMSQDL